ncbi:MAG: ATP cone domain-containing protein [Patescibacteria group bacterium]
MNHLITITKSDGTQQLFEEEKLINSLKHAGASDQAIEEIIEQVERSMKDGMTTNEIYGHAFSLLRKHSVHTAVKYSVRRALAELGPDGFPFEKFVSRIFHAWGYDTLTDQHVMGACIEHEMDVVAWKDDTLAMVEAKFHNEFGLKSDVKVALYVKARFDDIALNEFDYGGTRRKLTERWLFTNTKFTDQAVKYGSCNNLRLIGWNYPSSGNLHTLIEELGLHPITCVTSLNHQQKKDLIGRNIITCADLVKRPEILTEIGVRSEEDIQKMLEEAKLIMLDGK